jgi:HSP20 family protein
MAAHGTMLRRYSPASELVKLQEDVNRLFAELSGHLSGATLQTTAGWVPNVDLSEDGRECIIRAELPGIAADDLQIIFREGQLHIRGEKKRLRHETQVRYLCMERNYGKFSRSIQLNMVLDIDAASARLHNGVLTIVLPKRVNRRRFEKIIPVEVA